MKLLIELTLKPWVVQVVAAKGLGYTWLWGAGREGDRLYLDLGPMFLSVEAFSLDADEGDDEDDVTVH